MFASKSNEILGISTTVNSKHDVPWRNRKIITSMSRLWERGRKHYLPAASVTEILRRLKGKPWIIYTQDYDFGKNTFECLELIWSQLTKPELSNRTSVIMKCSITAKIFSAYVIYAVQYGSHMCLLSVWSMLAQLNRSFSFIKVH